MTRLEADIPADPAAISDLTSRTMDFLSEAGVDARASYHVALVLEEILTNIATHGGQRGELAKVRIAIEPERIAGEILDRGAPFDPRTSPPPDLTADAAERPIGGLGVYLVTKLTSELGYARQDGSNRTTFAVARGRR